MDSLACSYASRDFIMMLCSMYPDILHDMHTLSRNHMQQNARMYNPTTCMYSLNECMFAKECVFSVDKFTATRRRQILVCHDQSRDLAFRVLEVAPRASLGLRTSWEMPLHPVQDQI